MPFSGMVVGEGRIQANLVFKSRDVLTGLSESFITIFYGANFLKKGVVTYTMFEKGINGKKLPTIG